MPAFQGVLGGGSSPKIATITPAYGPTAGGLAVTIEGGGFTGVVAVTIGGAACTSVSVVDDTTITCTTPAGTSGAKDVVIGTATLSSGFTYQAGPSISGGALDVSSGTYTGGTIVTVTGCARIEVGATLTVGGVAHALTRVSSTSFSFVTKAVAIGSIGAKDLVVTNPDGQSGTKSGAFTYNSSPVIATIAPAFGALAGGLSVVLRGSGFTGASGVTIGGAAATSVVVDSDTQITCTTPAGTSGAKDVVIGTATLSSGFTYQAGPDVNGGTLDVTSGQHFGGDTITLTGCARIEVGATLTVGGVAHALTRVSSTSFSFVTKAIAVTSLGAKDVVVTNPDGQSGTKSSAYTYYAGEGAQFTSGAAMDAAAVVGRRYELIGASTGATICSLECVTTGPVTYRLLGICRLYQASGTEFDGVFKPVAVGTGSVPTWGTPGSRTTGGAQYAGTGTYEWQGLVATPFWATDIFAAVYIDTLPPSPAAYDAILVGLHRDANSSVDAGGLGRVAANNSWAVQLAANVARELGSGTGVSQAAISTPTVDVEWGLALKTYKTTTSYGRVATFQRASTALAAQSGSGASDSDGRVPCFTCKGEWTARVVEWSLNIACTQ